MRCRCPALFAVKTLVGYQWAIWLRYLFSIFIPDLDSHQLVEEISAMSQGDVLHSLSSLAAYLSQPCNTCRSHSFISSLDLPRTFPLVSTKPFGSCVVESYPHALHHLPPKTSLTSHPPSSNLETQTDLRESDFCFLFRPNDPLFLCFLHFFLFVEQKLDISGLTMINDSF